MALKRLPTRGAVALVVIGVATIIRRRHPSTGEAAAGTIDVPAFAVLPLAPTFSRIMAFALGLCETGLLAERLAAASVSGLGSQFPGRFAWICVRVDAHLERLLANCVAI